MQTTPGGPAIVLALVLAEAAVGGLAVLWLVPAWGQVRNGFFKLVGAVLVAFAVLAWLASRAPLAGAPGGPTAVTWLEAFAFATVVWYVLHWFGAFARAPKLARWVAIAASAPGFGAFSRIAAVSGVHASVGVAGLQLLAGALFVGAVTDGLLLGHWHLVDRKLSRRPLYNINLFFLAGCAAAAIAALAGGTGGGSARSDLSPLLGVGVLTVSIAVGLAALCALIGFFIRALVRENSLQSATGLFYLGVIMAFASEFAAKVRFF